MKTRNIILLMIFASLIFGSCEEYLEKTPKADISEEDVFTTWENFQGFVETMYDDIVEPVHLTNSFGEFNNGDDIIPTRSMGWIEGAYFFVISSGKSQYYNTNATRCSGTWNGNSNTRQHAIWQNSWYGIRAANVTFANLHRLVDATEEQKRFIEGQAYFFRAYFHWELMKAWGDIPFIDTVFSADSDMNIPQQGLYITAEKIIKDFQRAADLLPIDWDDTETGKPTLGINRGRATKGSALANLAEVLLYCGSPLFHGVETGQYTYNVDYCKRAAEAAWKVIQIAENGRYALVPWEQYSSNFFIKINNSMPWTTEHIFQPPWRGTCRYFTSSFTTGHLGTDAWYSAPTQNYVELFEMANGLPIDDPESGHDLMDPWSNRDPRFRYNILCDRDTQVMNISDDRMYFQTYIGGRERTAVTSLTGFGYRKYWDETINRINNGWNNYSFYVPKIRLAEVYLFYAEAANEAYNGPNGKHPDANLTALDAVNKIRERAYMPGVNAKFLVNKEKFRERIWNERAVELAYENKRWYDLRRWYVHHLPKHKELYELQFDKEWTYFNRVLAKTIAFSDQHYWLPFPTNQITLYPGWKQNPGW